MFVFYCDYNIVYRICNLCSSAYVLLNFEVLEAVRRPCEVLIKRTNFSIIMLGSKTCSGSAYGGRCYFPFVYQGEKYSSCAAAADTYDGPWCATQKGVVTDESNWGYCLC